MDKAVQNQKTDDTKQPVASVGTMNKEGGVRASVEASEALPKIEQEITEFVQNSEPITPHVPEVGLTSSAEVTPVKTEPTGAVSLPMTEEEAGAIIKNEKTELNLHENVGEKAGEYTGNSRPWLAELVIKILKETRRRVLGQAG